MFTAASIRFFAAMRMAVECSAALPMMATTITPTNTSLHPNASAVTSAAPTRSSAITATPAVAASSSPSERAKGTGVCPSAACAPCPASPMYRWRCVRRVNTRLSR